MIFYKLLFLLCTITQGFNTQRICAKTHENGGHVSVEEIIEPLPEIQDQDEALKDQEICKKDTNTCYAFWKKDPKNDNITSIARGCWEVSGKGGCSSSVCHFEKHPTKSNIDTMFCCCTGNLCNLNISFVPQAKEKPVVKESNTKQAASGYSSETGGEWKALILGGCGGFFFLILLAILFCMWGPTSKDKINNQRPPQITQQQANNSYSMAHLSLDRVVGKGRYGTVWLGRVRDQQVAVKMFPTHYSQYFYNEKDIYTLPFMEHSALLTYFGSDEVPNKDGVGGLMVLVLSYCPLGSLQDYLKRYTLDLPTFFRMALSTTSALSHLHTEIHKQDKWKPCITHRDVNTKNILVREDLSCCLADLGLAVKITGSHYYTLGEEQHAETKSINDVGTLRYMAPEVLEGAVNLRDCETSLKQIDVYALGLVLWEMSMRVVDFYNKPTDVQPYALPFEREVGLHPTFEEMQILVCRNKARPLFPQEWKCNQSTTTIRETVEDCTDQDGEARLTALCVHERINQLYRGSSQGGSVSPTLNQTNASFFASNYNNNNNNIKCDGNEINFGDKELTDGCVSEGTVETMVTLSPSESYPVYLSTIAKDPIIQPHQGRNPCMERNLLSCDSSEELCIVQTSSKHKRHDGPCEESECLVIAEPWAHQTAIPYVQNRPFSIPKQVNLPIKTQTGLVASLIKFIKKKDDVVQDTSSLTHVIVSPFEERPPRRPSSLQLLPPSNHSQEEEEVVEEDEKRLKELSSRIKTPGDLPPSVRKKRGNRARLSLYDDRMMSNSVLDSTF